MRTLASELGPHVEQSAAQPRIYADANVPAGVVLHMRQRLKWDVLAVIEDEALRRASDAEHFRMASMLRRTLITLDDDFLDDQQFPPADGCGVIVLSAPDEPGLVRLLVKIDRAFFGAGRGGRGLVALPFAGRKIQVHPDWSHAVRTRRRRRRRKPASPETPHS